MADWIGKEGGKVLVSTVKDKQEKYGRYLATVMPQGSLVSLNVALIQSGHGQPYMQ